MTPALTPHPIHARSIASTRHERDGQKFTYTHNPWGQLVEVRDRNNGILLAEYTYNGLGMRLTERTDTNDSADTGQADGVVNTHDPVFYLATDPAGRRTAVYRGADAHPKETYIYHAPTTGSGPLAAAAGAGAAPILRDRNRSLTDPRLWATEEAEPERYERLYYAANARGQVVALVDHAGALVEQYRWSATCVPFLVPLGDVNADGVVDADDAKLIKDLSGSPTYQVRGDLNLDGVIDSADEALVTANLGRAGGRASTDSARLRDGLYDGDVFPGAWSVMVLFVTCGFAYTDTIIEPGGTEPARPSRCAPKLFEGPRSVREWVSTTDIGQRYQISVRVDRNRYIRGWLALRLIRGGNIDVSDSGISWTLSATAMLLARHRRFVDAGLIDVDGPTEARTTASVSNAFRFRCTDKCTVDIHQEPILTQNAISAISRTRGPNVPGLLGFYTRKTELQAAVATGWMIRVQEQERAVRLTLDRQGNAVWSQEGDSIEIRDAIKNPLSVLIPTISVPPSAIAELSGSDRVGSWLWRCVPR